MKSQSDKTTAQQLPAAVSGTTLPSTRVRHPLPEFQDSQDLRDYLETILRHKWLVGTFLVGVFFTTLVVSLAMKPVFKASGRLELTLQAPKVTKFEDLLASQLQTKEFMQTQVTLLQSEALARRVIEKLHLVDNPAFNPDAAKKTEAKEVGVLRKWKDMIKELLPSHGDTRQDEPRFERLQLQKKVERKFSENLDVSLVRDTTIISLHFSCTDAELAQHVINALIQEFIAWQVDKKVDAASAAKQQLEKQLELARISLERSETNLKEFAKRAGIVSLDTRLNLIYRELEETNNALAAAEADRLSKEALYLQAREGNVSTLPMVVQNKLIQDLRQEEIKAMAEYQELSESFRPDYPKMKNLKGKMQDLERLINREEMRILDSLKSDYLAAVKREEALREGAHEKKTLALELNDMATEYKIFEREVETNKLFHQSLLERSKEIDAKVGTELGNIQVVEYATLPLTPYKPNVSLNLLVAIAVGLLGGVGAAFFMEYLDNTFKRVEEVSDRFQVPILGVLPLVTTDEVKDLDSTVRLKPRASFSEAIRTARASIQLSSSRNEPPKTLLVTSTGAAEGKSTIAANLAQAFASYEKSVVIIDSDLRKPRLHKTFGANGTGPKRAGLSQYLSGICTLDEVIHRTEVPNLSFIPSGPIPPNPAEMLASQDMTKVLDTLGKTFDRIILDAPPAAGFADVLEMAQYVDAVILVVTLGQTHREALRIFRRSLHNVGGSLLGCIINKLDLSYHYGGYYYKYYKYYHSYYHRPEDEQASELFPKTTDQKEADKS